MVAIARSPPPTNDELCATNSGVLAVRNGTSHIDVLVRDDHEEPCLLDSIQDPCFHRSFFFFFLRNEVDF